MKPGKKILKKTWEILKDTGKSLNQHEPIIYSAAIAFFTIFSLPAILIVLTLAGSAFFSEKEVREEIVYQLEGLISPEVGGQIGVVLENVVQVPSGIWGILIGVLVVGKSATIIFFIIQKALNSVWQVRVKEKVSYLLVLKHRLIALALVAGLGLVLLLSLLLDTVIFMFGEELYSLFEEFFTPAVRVINRVFYLAMVLFFFVSILKFLPDVKVTWKDAAAGGLITAVLFLIGKQLINYILGSIKVVGIYAAAGSFVVVLLWVFYSSVILFLGAILTKAYANYHGRQAIPTAIAYKYAKERVE
ncbi:YihY/virulence factor BrkB family protein [soil metagenome]